jgi:general stress protein 26
MAVSKRSGPDFLFLANKHSNKMADLEQNKEVSITFHDSSKQDWISVTGEAVTTSNDDPRIKQIYSKIVSAWFGDLGDGVHTGGPEDPRMSIIEVKAKCRYLCMMLVAVADVFSDISYYKSTTGKLGSMAEIGTAVFTGNVAMTGDLREMGVEDIKQARVRDSKMSS